MEKTVLLLTVREIIDGVHEEGMWVGCRCGGPGCCVGCIKLETESCQILCDDCIKNSEKNWDSNLLRLNFSDVG